MPIQPFIFVGVGGTGGKTLGAIRKTLSDTLVRIGWGEGWPTGWQFVHVDVPADPDANSDDLPYSLPRTSYVPLTTVRSTYEGFHNGVSLELEQSCPDEKERYLAWECWRPEPPSGVKVQISNGAGQYRAIGRVCVLRSLKLVDQALKNAFDAAQNTDSPVQLRRVQALIERKPPSVGNAKPIIFVIGSVSGGSGSGMFLDVCDVLRAHGHNEINSVLFTPEVFEDTDGKIDPGVAPNTFLALSEVSNSMWTHAQADAPLSRDRLFARAGVRYPVGHSGPTTALLVGRRNRSVTFKTADEVFGIVGRSLGQLALDEGLTTEVVAYDLANGNAVAVGARDGLKLSPASGARDVAPFRALGFARLTLGRDYFIRYATDRLLRRVALRLLDAHLEMRDEKDLSSDEELKQKRVQEVWPSFLDATQLDEVDEENAISTPLNTWSRPSVAAARDYCATRIRNAISADAERGNVNHAEARRIATVEVQRAQDPAAEKGFGLAVAAESRQLALDLQEKVQATLQKVIMRTVASHGLPVTIDLMDRLIERSREGVASLERERRYVANKLDEVSQLLSQVPAGTPATFKIGALEHMNRIVDDAEKVFRRLALQKSLEHAQDFLDDLVDNLLGSWRRALSDADGLLRMELRPDVGRSPLAYWPGDEGMPEYLKPSKVEFLLDGIDDMPAQFVSVIERSVEGVKALGAVKTATEQITAGEELGLQARTRPIATVEQVWVPKSDALRNPDRNRAAAQIVLHLELSDLEARTHAWLIDQEKFVGKFLQHSMSDYLTDPLTPAPQRKERAERLVGQFEKMLTSSLPLVALEPQLTNLIHGHDVPPYNLHLSTINVPSQLAELRSRLTEVAEALLNAGDGVRFSNNPRQDATMMTLLKEPYHMLEVASVMAPISEQWLQGGPERDLWQYRRARPLGEWVPIGPDARKMLIAGWFAARLMGLATTGAATATQLAVVVGGQTHQIPTRGVRPPNRRDHVGMLLEALPAAMLACFERKTLEGIKPYEFLIDIGDKLDKEEGNTVADWLGASGGSMAQEITADVTAGSTRSDAARALIEKWRTTYQKMPSNFGQIVEARTHPTYEVYADALEALDRLEASIDRQDPEDVY